MHNEEEMAYRWGSRVSWRWNKGLRVVVENKRKANIWMKEKIKKRKEKKMIELWPAKNNRHFCLFLRRSKLNHPRAIYEPANNVGCERMYIISRGPFFWVFIGSAAATHEHKAALMNVGTTRRIFYPFDLFYYKKKNRPGMVAFICLSCLLLLLRNWNV